MRRESKSKRGRKIKQSRLNQGDLHNEVLRQLEKAHSEAKAIRSSDDERIHQIRKRCKRIRALLKLTDSGDHKEARKCSRRVRAAAKRLSSLRDSQVIDSAFDVVANHPLTALKPATIKRVCRVVRVPLDSYKPNEQCKLSAATARRQFESAIAQLRSVRFNRKTKIRFESLAAQYDQVRSAVSMILQGDTELFHDLRKAVKAHRYQGLFLNNRNNPSNERLETHLNQCNALGELLGQAQDIEVLRGKVIKIRGELIRRDSQRFLDACEMVQDEIHRSAMQIACERFFVTGDAFCQEFGRGG